MDGERTTQMECVSPLTVLSEHQVKTKCIRCGLNHVSLTALLVRVIISTALRSGQVQRS